MKVTVICPTHNRRQYIPQTIASFLSQTFTDSELIILDDGTDSIVDLIPDNPRIKYIRLEGPGLSTGVKRNICCEHAQGEFIVHFDDDDWSAPGRIAHQISELERTQKQVLTYYNILYWNVDTRRLYLFHPTFRGTPHGASFCYRKAWWAQHKFDDNCLEDTEFGYAAERAEQYVGVDAEKFMVVRAHSSNHCVTALSMGTVGIPQVDLRELPAEFPLSLPLPLKVKVTVICPTYNRRRYLPSMIACFLSQTFTDSELIILDDGTDNVADLIPYNPRIRYIRLEGPRRTTGAKRNICCEQAQGEFIIHFDDDDWSAPSRITDQVSKLERSGKQVMTYHNMLYWNMSTHKIYRYHPVYCVSPHGATFCYRKTWWESHKFDDIMVGEDTNLGYGASRVGQLVGVNAEKLMVIRAHNKNTCTSSSAMGTKDIPETSLNEIPPEFFTSLPRVLIAIVTCKKYAARQQALRDTWVPLAQAAGYDVEFFDGERLGVPDDYIHLPLKAKAIFKWAQEHQYDEMLKVDDDTYIQVSHIHHVDADYAGNHCDANDWGRPDLGFPHYKKGTWPHHYITGGAVWFSKKAIQILVDTPLNNDFADDRWVGQVMADAGILRTILPDFYWHPFRVPSGTDFTVITALPSTQAVLIWHKLIAPVLNLPTEPSPPLPLQPPQPQPLPDPKVARCNRHNVSACSVCIAHGWQFRQSETSGPAHIGSDIRASSSQQAPTPPPQPNPQIQTAASKALTGHVKPSQGALYRNRNADNRRKIG